MRKRQIFVAAAVALFLGAPLIVRGEQEMAAGKEQEKTILDGIYLESVDLSGMTREEAAEAADRRMKEITGYQIKLWMDDQSVSVSAAELGVSGKNEETIAQAAAIGQAGNVIKRYKVKKDLEEEPIQLPLSNQVDEQAVRTALETYCSPLDREAKDYGLTRENGKFQVQNGERGVAGRYRKCRAGGRNYGAPWFPGGTFQSKRSAGAGKHRLFFQQRRPGNEYNERHCNAEWAGIVSGRLDFRVQFHDALHGGKWI